MEKDARGLRPSSRRPGTGCRSRGAADLRWLGRLHLKSGHRFEVRDFQGKCEHEYEETRRNVEAARRSCA